MSTIRTVVKDIQSFTTPSGQVKPFVKLQLDNSEIRTISLINYNQLGSKKIVPNSVVYFENELKPKNIIQVCVPNDVAIHMCDYKKYIPSSCPACGDNVVKYKQNYWCINGDCEATKEPRLRKVLRNSPASFFYNADKIIQYARNGNIITNSDYFNPDMIEKNYLFLKNKWLKYDNAYIRKELISCIKKWGTISKLFCLEARIGSANAIKLTQNYKVGLDIINKYTVRDMMQVGIPQLEASKIRTLLDFDYNQNLIESIIKVSALEM